IGASVDACGEPMALKLSTLADDCLIPWTKELNTEGVQAIKKQFSPAVTDILVGRRLVNSRLPECFKAAKRWLNEVFNGIGSKYLQQYLNEYCFRWNIAASGQSAIDAWEGLLFSCVKSR